MATEDRTRFERRLDALTATFVEGVTECVAALPELLDRYADGASTDGLLARTRERESECDRVHREVSSLVSTADAGELGIRLTGVHLNRGQLLELYARLDDVADAAERFAADLVGMDPRRVEAGLAGLRAMADSAVRAVDHLGEAVTGFVRTLCDPEYSLAVVDTVETVRRIEGRVDERRDEVVATAFRRGDDAAGLVYRELAFGLDSVVDAAEDVTDRMFLLAGDNDWLALDP